MFQIRKNLTYVAIIVATLTTLFCPFLKVFIVGNWNLYEVDVRLFYITCSILLLILISTIFNFAIFYKYLVRIYFIWIVISLLAVYFQINNYFGMKLVDGLITKSVVFKWGWIVLIFTSIITLFGIKQNKIDNHEK